MIPQNEAEKIAYYKEFAESGMGPIARSFQYGAPNGPWGNHKTTCVCEDCLENRMH